MILLLYWLLYSAITETRPCDLGLIALLLLRLMYGKLNHYVIIYIIVLTNYLHLYRVNHNKVSLHSTEPLAFFVTWASCQNIHSTTVSKNSSTVYIHRKYRRSRVAGKIVNVKTAKFLFDKLDNYLTF